MTERKEKDREGGDGPSGEAPPGPSALSYEEFVAELKGIALDNMLNMKQKAKFIDSTLAGFFLNLEPDVLPGIQAAIRMATATKYNCPVCEIYGIGACDVSSYVAKYEALMAQRSGAPEPSSAEGPTPNPLPSPNPEKGPA